MKSHMSRGLVWPLWFFIALAGCSSALAHVVLRPSSRNPRGANALEAESPLDLVEQPLHSQSTLVPSKTLLQVSALANREKFIHISNKLNKLLLREDSASQAAKQRMKQALVPSAPAAHSRPAVGPAAHSAQWVQQRIRWTVLLLVISLYVLALASVIHAKYRPSVGHIKAFISDEDAVDVVGEDAPETEDEQDVEASPHGTKNRLASCDTVLPGQYIKSGHVTISSDDLMDNAGLTAMCIFPPDEISGISKLRYRYALPLISVQALCLQLGLFYFLATQLVPRASTQMVYHELPHSIVFIAIYLHFLQCCMELPYCLRIFQHLPDFHEDLSDLTWMAALVITDGFVVPLVSFILGALYLCTSRTIGDVILNAVAVAFVTQIDNWILSLKTRVNFMAGKVASKVVHLPVDRPTMRKFAWGVVFVPILPVLASAAFCYIGFELLQL